uniref:Uncharacterized protein n=1 Tax=Trichogramma kaykai TaxID=54128 RepID=A0ABD2X3G3_9HYME
MRRAGGVSRSRASISGQRMASDMILARVIKTSLCFATRTLLFLCVFAYYKSPGRATYSSSSTKNSIRRGSVFSKVRLPGKTQVKKGGMTTGAVPKLTKKHLNSMKYWASLYHWRSRGARWQIYSLPSSSSLHECAFAKRE